MSTRVSAQNKRASNVTGTKKTSDRLRYTKPAIALHWLIGMLIIGMIILGYFMTDIPKGTPGRAVYFNLHKSRNTAIWRK
ncbi:cytochrome b/b6 domain-containing protein [Glaciimonas sp. GG7]